MEPPANRWNRFNCPSCNCGCPAIPSIGNNGPRCYKPATFDSATAPSTVHATTTTTAASVATTGRRRYTSQSEDTEGDSADIILVVFGVVLMILSCLCGFFRHLRKRRAAAAASQVAPAAATAPTPIPAPTLPITGKAELIEEEKPGAISVNSSVVPAYWTNKRAKTGRAFDEMIYVNADYQDRFDELLKETYHPKSTQDRPCPNATCVRTAGGCPCVQPGGSPGLPTEYRVRRIIRVEDSGMWQRYVNKRDAISRSRTGGSCAHFRSFEPAVRTDCVTKKYPDTFEPLQSSINEVYLWHGTFVRYALAIAQNDFNINLAGTGRGTMYGAGAYLAECSTKADEYARDEPQGYYDGIYAVLLVRATMGKLYYTTMRDEQAGSKITSGEFDSTCGDRLKSAGTFRELVVYDADQIYPEYVILYQRVHASDDPADIVYALSHPFHMQLPVYWANVHRNPRQESFDQHFNVRRHTRLQLQNLVSASLQGKARVMKCRRIETSRIWNSYVDYKRKLRDKLGMNLKLGARARADSGEKRMCCIPANELDGIHDSGKVLTSHLLELTAMTEEAVSIQNLEAVLNEHMLWHGTSKAAAMAIIQDDFRIAKGGEAVHGTRFGNGAYFAESLDKSLSYATEEGGVKYALLCRVTCGEFYYTEENWESDASIKAENLGRDSVLANPNKDGPREFIVLTEEQVYPEWILELAPGRDPETED